MTFSSLISGTVPHHDKFSSRQGRAITRVLQHHWAGMSGGDARLMNPNQQASSNYIIYSDGRIVGQVPEEYRAWTSGSFEADAGSITFEVQNTSLQVNGNDNDPNSWKVSDASVSSMIRLIADIASRYKWGAVAKANYRGHREFYSTSCPGGYLWNKMSTIRNSAHSVLTGGKVVVAPAAPPTKGKTIWVLANEVAAGLHGNGDARKKSLGKNYQAVQNEINRRAGILPAAAKAKPKSIAQLADEVENGVHGNGDARKRSLGSKYNAVQAEINRRHGASRPKANTGPSISQLADAMMRGAYGNGVAQRKKALGSKYNAVQAEVNRRYGL